MATGKVWTHNGRKYRYRYSGKFSQWKKKQILELRYGGGRRRQSRWVDIDKAWRPTRLGEFRRKWQ